MDTKPATPGAGTADAPSQRDALLDSQRNANADQPRNFKEDALQDKVVDVEPDSGPTNTKTFDPPADRSAGSGNETGTPR